MKESEISRIEKALGVEKKKDEYYVYMLCENVDGVNKPFYIGKGTGKRILDHEKDAEKEIEERKREVSESLSSDKKLSAEDRIQQEKILFEKIQDDISAKYAKINELGADNVIKVIVKYGLTNDEALMAESALINAYSLTNDRSSLTNVINGHMSEREKNNISCSTKARTLQEFLDNCAVAEKCITDIKEPILFVKINRLYPQCMLLPDSEQEAAIYDASRACWELRGDKVKKIKYVLALYQSQVVGIYSVNENSWKQRFEIDDSFPTFPPEQRSPEIKYSKISKACSTLNEMRTCCDNYDEFLKISKINKDDAGFNKWKNTYYFNRTDDEIPEDILSLKNCILVDAKGNKLFSGRYHRRYNFDIKNDIVKFVTESDD